MLIALLPAVASRKQRKRRRQIAVSTLLGEYDGDCLMGLLDDDSTTVKELSEYGHELERDGRRREALQCYARAIRSKPNDSTGWFDMAVAHQNENKALALQMYAHGVTLNPSAFHYNQLGVMLRQNRQQIEACHRFAQAAQLAPVDAADPLFNLGGSYESLGRQSEALHAYRRALDLEHKNEARIHNNIGNVLVQIGQWKEALVAYNEAHEADPDFPETYQNLARVLEDRGRYEEAAAQLAHAARLLPHDAADLHARAAKPSGIRVYTHRPVLSQGP